MDQIKSYIIFYFDSKMITEKIKEIIDKMKAIQVHILNYLDNEEDTEQNFQKHINILDDHQIHDNRSYLQLFINLIKNIADNHRRTPSFFIKIEKIVTIYKDDINKHFTKSELLTIFKKSKRLLLLLIKNEQGWSKIDSLNYKQYRSFTPQRQRRYVR